MSSSAFLVLGVGNAQLDLLELLHARDVRICGAANSAFGPGAAMCHAFEEIDVRDVDHVLAFAERERVQAIYSVGSDVAMPTVSSASERLGLPYFVPASVANVCNDKGMLRSALAEAGLPTPGFTVMAAPDDTCDVSMPAILKPLDSQGQRGISHVTSRDELASAFSRAVQFSSQGKAILEEFIDGPEISVNTYSLDGKRKFALISSRVVWKGLPGGIIKAHEFPPAGVGEAVQRAVLDSVDCALAALGINNGPAYFQIKLKNGVEPFIIEATPRLDGCHLWRLIKISCGIDLLEASVAHLLGERFPEFSESINARPCSLEFFCQPPGTEFKRSKFDARHAEFLKWYYQDDDSVKQINGLMEKCGYIIRKG